MSDQRKFLCLYRHPGSNDLRVLSLKDSPLTVTLETYGLMKTMIDKLQESGTIGDASIIEMTVYDFLAADPIKRVEVENRLLEIARRGDTTDSYMRQSITEEANLTTTTLKN